MSAALPFLVLGLLLIVLLILSAVWRHRFTATRYESFQDDRFFAIRHAEPLPPALAARLFGPEDREFIAKQGCASLKRLFCRQRKELGLCWLRSVRANADRLMRIHNRAAGKNFGLEPLLELKILAEYFAIHAICQILALAICVRGPNNLSRMVAYAGGLSDQLHEGIKQLLPAELAAENGSSQVYLKSGRTRS
ncbi:MAG: hypothetical protein DMG40_23485 [Acidobacteria bacterium]|nr:MAG: hypothetical protein DMG40_23485 [Acidobacteriota bacterium]